MSYATENRHTKRLRLMFVAASVGLAAALAGAADLVADLQGRLSREGVDAVNAYLSTQWESKMLPLGRMTERCEPRALRLTIALLDTRNAEALEAHGASLELAMGHCPERLLPQVPLSFVSRVCSVDSFEDQGTGQKGPQELERRIAHLESARTLASTERGVVCLATYRKALRDRL